MALKEFDQARLLPENQDPVSQFALDSAEAIVLTAGVAWPLAKVEPISRVQINLPVPTEKKEVTCDLDREWEKQADTLAHLFANPLKMTKSEYKGRFFDFRFPQPEAYEGRFDNLVLVQTPIAGKLPLSIILEITGINKSFDFADIQNWSESKFIPPVSPYATWAHEGTLNRGLTVRDVRDSLANDARGGKTIDGIGFFIQNPDILKDLYIDFPGDQVGTDHTPLPHSPFLHHWGGKTRLSHQSVDLPRGKNGSMVAGIEVRTQTLKS